MADPENMVNSGKPNLNRRLFWDSRFEDIDWQKAYLSVIPRVIERGTEEEIEELIRFYGWKKVVNALKKEIVYLPDFVMEKVTRYFGIREHELACYERKQSRRGYWI